MSYIKDFDNAKGFSFQRAPGSNIFTKLLKERCNLEDSYLEFVNYIKLAESVKQMIETDQDNAIIYFSLFNLNYNAIFTAEEFNNLFIKSYNKYKELLFKNHSIYNTICYCKYMDETKSSVDPDIKRERNLTIYLPLAEMKAFKQHLLNHINTHLLKNFHNLYKGLLEDSVRSILDKFYTDYTIKDYIYIDKNTNLPYNSIAEQNMSMFFKLTNAIDIFNYYAMFAVKDILNLENNKFNLNMIYYFMTECIACNFEDFKYSNDYSNTHQMIIYYNYAVNYSESYDKVTVDLNNKFKHVNPYETLGKYVGGLNGYYLLNEFICATIELKDKFTLLLLKSKDYRADSNKNDFYFKIIEKNIDKLNAIDLVNLHHILFHTNITPDSLFFYIRELYAKLRDCYSNRYKDTNFYYQYKATLDRFNDILFFKDDAFEDSIDDVIYYYFISLVKMEILTKLHDSKDKLYDKLDHSVLKDSGFKLNSIYIPNLPCYVDDKYTDSTITYIQEDVIGPALYNLGGDIYYNKRFFKFKLILDCTFTNLNEESQRTYNKHLAFVIRLNTKRNTLSVTLTKRNRSKFNSALIKAGIEKIIHDILLEKFMKNYDNFYRNIDSTIDNILSSDGFPYFKYDGNILNIINELKLTYML